ncbi:DoxX family protein [Rhizobium cauense]|uniref:DoxX family protein n=1 Tax=Rhizobium cauense TaxID=1166683 RepID=UPI001C6E2818|nr:DoxX family protein [Rhizobium cauense]MBW9116493.1 DoxX family protein [Rhizobium cauense]
MQTLAGRALSAFITIVLLLDASVNYFAPDLLKDEMNAVQFPTDRAPALAIIMVVCALLYSIPRTALLGAILVTGFFGGAICVHLRMGELFSPPQLIALLLGTAAWGGLYLRYARLRELILRGLA